MFITTKKYIFTTSFLVMSCDEVTTVDNQSWVNIHAYLVDGFKCISILLNFKKLIGGGTIDNLTIVIVNFLLVY